MLLDKYDLKSDKSQNIFEFVSDGKKGKITKVIQYSETHLKDFYNIGFGDRENDTGEVNDEVISNNGDSLKVLATVAFTVYSFTERIPDAWIFAIGNNKARTRLYQMGISNNLKEIENDFEILGLRNDHWEKFRRSTNYEAFLVRRKNRG